MVKHRRFRFRYLGGSGGGGLFSSHNDAISFTVNVKVGWKLSCNGESSRQDCEKLDEAPHFLVVVGKHINSHSTFSAWWLLRLLLDDLIRLALLRIFDCRLPKKSPLNVISVVHICELKNKMFTNHLISLSKVTLILRTLDLICVKVIFFEASTQICQY